MPRRKILRGFVHPKSSTMPGINDLREIVYITTFTMPDDLRHQEVVYIDFEPHLRSYAPAGHPHLLGLKCLHPHLPVQMKTEADVVATILFFYKLETLKAFLDLERPNVHLLSGRSDDIDFCISRRNRVVKVI